MLRWLPFLLCGAILGLAGVAPATTIDLTGGPDSSGGFIDDAFFEFNDFQSSGTGTFAPIVRLAANGMEQGYNTSGRRVPFDEKKDPNFTRDIRIGDLGIFTRDTIDYYAFELDINEQNGAGKSLLSLDMVQIYTSAVGSQTTTDVASLGALRFDLDATEDSWVLLDHRNDPGSGKADMLMLIPTDAFAGASDSDFLYLYSLFGEHEPSGAGFEEWRALTSVSMIPEPGTAALLGVGLATLAMGRGRRRHHDLRDRVF